MVCFVKIVVIVLLKTSVCIMPKLCIMFENVQTKKKLQKEFWVAQHLCEGRGDGLGKELLMLYTVYSFGHVI